MDDRRKMLEAHVRFELDRWGEAGLRDAVAEEVAAVLGRLGEVAVAELVDPDGVREGVLRVVNETPIAGELAQLLADGVSAVHQRLSGHDAQLDELVEPEDYGQIVEAVVGMRQVRHEVIEQITTSSVYSQLIGHVLYHGIKNYLVSQNVLARKIPGASSMLRLGQNAMNAAAPSLERNIDRQLTAFISGNVAETVQGSSAFLIGILDDDMIRAVGAELWTTNATRKVSEFVQMLSEPSAVETLHAGREIWEGLRGADVVVEVVSAAVDWFFEEHGERPLDDLLADLEITPELIVDQLVAAGTPLLATLRDSGLLEERIRARLEAFYLTWPES